ncbi:UNVERIFIED_CONTAM: hypothetical protein GTU68_015892 [Idotea baltica]|nr:hypothetical protein [Idotea baltica]
MSDLKEAMKAKDTVALSTLRALKTALTNAAIESGNKDNVVSDADALAIVRKQIKQRNDSIEQFETAGRAELAENEKAEITVLEKYLPAGLSAEEVSAIVADAVAESGASSRADMGKVMKIVQEKVAGRADGKTLSQEVMKHLS